MDQEQERLFSKIYTYCAASVFLLMFINLGTVLDWKRLKHVLSHPVGPFLGFISRYFLMPTISLGLGQLLLHGSIELQLGLLFTAISPSGGFANIFTIFLKGNIGLSLTATSFNSVMALAMLPLWILVIVPAVYDELDFWVPFIKLAISSTIIISAILIGVAMRSFIPKTTRFIFRFLKPILVTLSLILVALTVGLNFFVFKELNWKISIAVILLPFIGYLFAFGLSKLFCQTTTDALTIAIETSVLSMTLPILLLRYCIDEDHINSTSVIPIASSIASVCLAFMFYAVRRIFGWNKKLDVDGFDENLLTIESLNKN